MLAIQPVDLFGLAAAGCPESTPMGPGTVKNPSGVPYWTCSSDVCLAQYAGNTYRDSLSALTKAGLPHTDHPNVLGTFKGAQRAINAYMAKKKWTDAPLIVDGHIGPTTFSRLRDVLENMVVEQEPFEGNIPRSVSTAALKLWCNSLLIYNIAQAAGTSTSFTIKKKAGESPQNSPVRTVTKGGASGKIPPPGGEKTQRGWVWWAVGGAALVGVVAVGVSLFRDDQESF